MARMKLDGVIEAVHYTTGGNIDYVRIFERHGTVWSDQILLNRNELSARLRLGKQFKVGARKVYFGSVFNTGAGVCQIDGCIVTEGLPGGRDLLDGVPIF
jgi:hypothetical protein